MEETLIVNYSSPIGTLQACFGSGGLRSFGLRSNTDEEKKQRGDPNDPRWMELSKRLDSYFRGRGLDVNGIDLDLSSISDFSRDVYLTLMKVPHGQLITYGELAERSGHPGGARAVGRSMNANPFLLIVPCHRVVARSSRGGRSIGGFGIGTVRKRNLLSLEGSIDEIR